MWNGTAEILKAQPTSSSPSAMRIIGFSLIACAAHAVHSADGRPTASSMRWPARPMSPRSSASVAASGTAGRRALAIAGDDDTADFKIAGFLELIGKKYTGSGTHGLMLAQDKAVAKKIFQFHGIHTPLFAKMLQEPLGGQWGEISVMMTYLFQGWNCRGPQKYRDMLLDIAAIQYVYGPNLGYRTEDE